VKSDRGGQITYHGPGQLIAYVLIDLRRRGWGVKQLVRTLEQAVIDLLAARGLTALRRSGAPGVYVDGRKIAQLGLRVRRGASYHGLSFNVDMDHEPFRCIKPCGYAGLETTDLATLAGKEHARMDEVKPNCLPSYSAIWDTIISRRSEPRAMPSRAPQIACRVRQRHQASAQQCRPTRLSGHAEQQTNGL